MIRTITKAAVLAAAAGSLNLVVATPADAQTNPVASGRRCGFASVTDPQAEGEVQMGQMNGGPLVAATAGATISITCSIQVGVATHDGADAAAATSAPMQQVASLPPTAISYPAPDGQPVYQCTEISINGTAYYWDATVTTPGAVPQLNEAFGWTTNGGARCDEAIRQEIFPGPLAPVIDTINEIVVQHVDPPICEVLTGLADDDSPPTLDIRTDGDVYVNGEWIWDCPEYGTSGT